MKPQTQEDFLNQVKVIHPTLDFNKSVFTGNLNKVLVTCTKHGDFEKVPKHLKIGQGCKLCSREAMGDKSRITQEEFIDRCKSIYGARYDLSKTVYTGMSNNIEVGCSEHGKFVIQPVHFVNPKGEGCPKCSKKIVARNLTLTKEEFVYRAKEVHFDRYTYESTIYVNSNTKVDITCKDHGIFSITPANFLNGVNCAECMGSNKSNTLDFIDQANKVHEYRYDYNKVNYVNNNTNVEILCKEHGSFYPTPKDHIHKKSGCMECSGRKKGTTKKFIIDATNVHGSMYSYTKSKYINSKTKLIVTCNTHGDFLVKPNSHISDKNGCPICKNSIQQTNLANFILSLGVKLEIGNRTILKPRELDLVAEEYKIAIEYNGLYYHSEQFRKNPKYHVTKTTECNKAGYRLIHIYEDEWLYKTEIVKNRLRHIFKKDTIKLYARKLELKKLSALDASNFVNLNHIQGSGMNPSIAYGLLDKGILVACMTFCKNRFSDEGGYELLRFCSTNSIAGGFSRLLKAFQREHIGLGHLISFSDKRWSDGEVYGKNGFTYVGNSGIGYDYIKRDKRFNRQKFMKHKLVDILEIFDPIKTESENCAINGYYRLWNCGMDKWALQL